MNDELKKAYGRGYNAGSHGNWPEHRPPLPPEPMIAMVFMAAVNLRNEADALIATFPEGDEGLAELGKRIDDFDNKMRGISFWLLEPEYTI